MLKRSLTALLILAFACATLSAQELSPIHQPTLTPQNSGTTNGLIAVSPVNPQVVWASGRAGTFTVTTDGGQTWNAGVVPGAEALQFRDVQGFSASVAYLMSIGTSGDPTDFASTRRWTAGPPGRYSSRTRIRMPSTTASRSGRRGGALRTATR